MECQELLKLLGDYVDGEVDPAICAHFESHLADCNPCQIVIDTLKRTVRLYKDNAVYEAPLEFRRRLHDQLGQKWRELHGEGE